MPIVSAAATTAAPPQPGGIWRHAGRPPEQPGRDQKEGDEKAVQTENGQYKAQYDPGCCGEFCRHDVPHLQVVFVLCGV